MDYKVIKRKNISVCNTPERHAKKLYLGIKCRIKYQKSYKEFSIPKYSFSRFYLHLLNKTNYLKIWDIWRKKEFPKLGIAPCIDRIDPYQGYNIENIRVITWSQNSKRARRSWSWNLDSKKKWSKKQFINHNSCINTKKWNKYITKNLKN